jgi:hypothetical protein
MDALLGPSPRATDEPQVSFEDSGADDNGSIQQPSILDVTDATIGHATTGEEGFCCYVSGCGPPWV